MGDLEPILTAASELEMSFGFEEHTLVQLLSQCVQPVGNFRDSKELLWCSKKRMAAVPNPHLSVMHRSIGSCSACT